MQGIILKNGDTISLKEKSADEIFDPSQCAVFIDNDERKVLLWKGSSSGMRDRFAAAHLAENLDKRKFGGAGRIVQNDAEIREMISSGEHDDISDGMIRRIGI